METQYFNTIKINTEKEKKEEKTIITFIQNKENNIKVFKVDYTDSSFSPNTKHIFYNTKSEEIEFTDETQFSSTLKQRIQYEIYKYEKKNQLQ